MKEKDIDIYGVMDYEKAYKEALEKARAGKSLEEIFPEFNEIEYERIRKAIVKLISDMADGHSFVKYGIVKKDALAYLERQKEQKPAEWCAEDETMFQCARWHLRNSINDGKTTCPAGQIEEWLKSLRPQPHWKPSEEQMEALK